MAIENTTDVADTLSTVQSICTVDAGLLGDAYLEAIMCRAANRLGFDFGLIGTPDADRPGWIKTRVMVASGSPQENFSYELRGTPCENVYGDERVCVYANAVNRLFPDDLLLEEMGIRAYVGAPLLSPDGNSLGVFVFMHRNSVEPSPHLTAVTEYLASRAGMEIMRETLLSQQREAATRRDREHRLAALGKVVSGVAHDFNNLLAGLQGHADLLARKAGENADINLHVEGINQIIQRAQSTTRTLLDFSSARPRRSGCASVGKVFDELVQMADQEFNANISVGIALGNTHQTVRMDEGHLHQILLNLVFNARDALPDGGSIMLSARPADNQQNGASGRRSQSALTAITVRDTGTGMTEEVIEKMYDPFFTTKPRDKGTGLGLTGVYQLVAAYGGEIAVLSKLGQGTEFTVFIPTEESTEAVAEPESDVVDEAKTHAHAGTQARILLAEDDSGIAYLTAELLEMEDYEVVIAGDGNAAFDEYMRAHEDGAPFDLLISDINMPGRNGYQLLRDIRAVVPAPKALVCTGDTLSSEAQELTKSNWCVLLEKPLVIEKMLDAIEEQLAEP